MSSLILAQDVAEVSSLQRIIATLSIMLSVGALLYALAKSRVRLPLRPAFDVGRLAVQVVGVLVMARLSGVTTSTVLLIGAAVLGVGLGAMQGQSLEVSVEQGRVWTRRSVLGVVIWGGGLVLMQVAGLANRAGAVRLGQAVAWFSIGVAVGLLFAKNQKVQVVRRTAGLGALTVLLALVAVGTFTHGEPAAAAAAQTDEELFLEEFMQFCGPESRTPSFDTCAEAWPTYWAGLNGQFDFCYDTQFAGPQCQRYFDSIMMSGQTDMSMFTCEGVYSQVPSCLGEEPPEPEPEPEPEHEPEPQPGPEPEPEPTRTETVTEDIDPNAVPDVVPIPDDGDLLERPSDPEPPSGQEGNESEGNEGSAGGSGSSSGSSDSGSSSSANGDNAGSGSGSGSDAGTGSGADGNSAGRSGSSEANGTDEVAGGSLPPVVPDDEDTVTGEEAVSQAVAGLLAAAVIGLVTWAEAFQTIDLLLQQGSGTAAAQYGHLQQQYPDYQGDPVGVGGGGGAPSGQTVPAGSQPSGQRQGAGSASIPSSQWIPGADSGGDTSSNGGHGPGSKPNWFPPSAAGGDDPGVEPNWFSEPGSSQEGPENTGMHGGTPTPGEGGPSPTGWGSTGAPSWADPVPSPTDFISPDPPSSSPPVGDGTSVGESDDPLPEDTRPADVGDDPYVPESMPEPEVQESTDGAPADQYSGDDVMDLLGGAELPTSMDPVEQGGGGMGVPPSRTHDLDHDGTADHVEYDLDGDGEFETPGRIVEDDAGQSVVVDANGNPLFEPEPEPAPSMPEPDPEPSPDPTSPTPAEPYEVDGHGVASSRFFDTDGDGIYDRWEADVDGDGVAERSGHIVRRDDDVFLVNEGEELPPVPEEDPYGDMLVGLAEDYGEANQAEPQEFDVGGHRTRLTDTDGDGEYDLVEGDTDGDGEFDVSHRSGNPPVGGTPEAAPETAAASPSPEPAQDVEAPLKRPEDAALPDGGNVESFESDMADLFAGDNPADRQWRGNDFMEYRDEDHDGRADLIRSDIDGDGDVDGSGRVTYDDKGRAEFDIGIDSDDDGIPDSRVRRFHDPEGRPVTEVYDEHGVLQRTEVGRVDDGAVNDPTTGDDAKQ